MRSLSRWLAAVAATVLVMLAPTVTREKGFDLALDGATFKPCW